MKRTLNDWTEAALESIADGGVASISVEGLAKELGVTKGSFYWHFTGRDALIAAALELWVSQVEAEVEALAADTDDPIERVRSFVSSVLVDPQQGYVDLALGASAGIEVVSSAVQRVSDARLGLLSKALRQLGMTPAQSERQARMVLASYLGHIQLRISLDGDKYLAKASKAYTDQLMESLAAL